MKCTKRIETLEKEVAALKAQISKQPEIIKIEIDGKKIARLPILNHASEED